MRSSIPIRRGRRGLAAGCFLEALESRLLLDASLIFQADFNGSGGGTGGAGNIVLTGGTGTLGTTAAVTNSVIGTTPFSATGGNYLNSFVPAGSTPTVKTIVNFNPADATHSWNALTGAMSFGGVNYLTLNGGIDFFVRPNNTQVGDTLWFRPVDVSNLSGTTGLRIILNGVSNQLQYKVVTGTGTLGIGNAPGSFTTSDSSLLPQGLGYIANPFTNGQIEHLGLTFNTDVTGKITIKLFHAPGTAAIDTTSAANLLANQSFYISKDIVGATPLPTGTWALTDRYGHAQATSVDYETVRLYQGIPETLPAMGIPDPVVPEPVRPVPSTVADFDARRDWLLSLNWSNYTSLGSAKYGMPFAVARLYQTNGADATAKAWTVQAAQEIDYVDEAHTQRDYGDVIFNPVGVVRAVYGWGNSFSPTQLNDIATAMREKYGWLAGGTENHELMRWSNAYLLAQKFGGDWKADGAVTSPRVVPTAALMLEAKSKLLTRIRQYLNQGEGEYLSPNYTQTHLWPMANLIDYANDPELKSAAEALMTYVLSLISVNVLDGYIVEPYARIVGFSNTGPDSLSYPPAARMVENESTIANWLYWGQIKPTEQRLTVSRYGGGPQLVYLAISNYRPPERLVRLANGQDGLPYETKSLHAQWHDKPGAVSRYGYRTDQYIMGSGMYNFYPDEFYTQNSLFGLSWTSPDPLPYLQAGYPYWYSDYEWANQSDGFPYWMKATNSPFQEVMQYKGTAITLFNHPVADPWPGRNYQRSDWYTLRDGHYNALPTQTFVTYPQTMDEVVTYSFSDPNVGGANNTWYFLREGNTYVGIRTLTGNTSTDYTSSNLFRAIFSNDRLNGNRYQSGYIVEVGTQSTAGTFAAFQAKLKTNPLTINWGSGTDPGQTVTYTDSAGNNFVMTYNTFIRTDPVVTNMIPPFPVAANMTLNGSPWNFNNWPMLQAPFLWLSGGVLTVQNTDGTAFTYDASAPAPAPIIVTHPQATGFSATVNAVYAFVKSGNQLSLNISAGAVTFTQDASILYPDLIVNVASGASAIFDSPQHFAGLNIANGASADLSTGGTNVLFTRSLSLTGSATLDLNDNDLILDYIGSTPLPTIRSLINSARNGGSWTGAGITSTAAKNGASHNTALGIMEAGEYLTINGSGALFAGQTLDSTMVLVKYTYNGDTDLNGTVNFDDYSRIDLGFNTQSTQGFAYKWLVGDFDFNSSINFDDYSLIDLAFNTQGLPL